MAKYVVTLTLEVDEVEAQSEAEAVDKVVWSIDNHLSGGVWKVEEQNG